MLGQSFGVFFLHGGKTTNVMPRRPASLLGSIRALSASSARCAVPCLVLPGNDTPHPAVIGAELAELLPNAEQLNPWKGPEHLDEQCERVIGFLEKHTP